MFTFSGLIFYFQVIYLIRVDSGDFVKPVSGRIDKVQSNLFIQ